MAAGISTSFFRRISKTFRWLFECTSLENVGLQAGRYSGKSRPDLNLTPHALHSVFEPMGPARHCGVFVTPQWLHLRGCAAPPPPPSPPFLFFFAGALSIEESGGGNDVVEDVEEGGEADCSVNDGDRTGQTRSPARARFVRALV